MRFQFSKQQQSGLAPPTQWGVAVCSLLAGSYFRRPAGGLPPPISRVITYILPVLGGLDHHSFHPGEPQEFQRRGSAMKAVVLHGYGGVEQLAYEDVPQPKPQAGEVLVKVVGTSVNPVDWKIRRGDMKDLMPLQLPAILGRDVAGTVAGVGANARRFHEGDKVMGLVQHAYAEFLVTKGETLALIPAGLEMEDAAALPLVLLTGAQLIEKGVQPQPGQTVLITGAMGSVGRSAVYVAKKHGMKVIAGVRDSQRKEAETLGADQVIAIDHDAGIARIGLVDAIADTVGGSVIAKLMPLIRLGGVLASVLGKPQGADGKDFTVRPVWAQPDAERLQQLAQAVAHGDLSIPVSKRMKLSQAGEAQKLAEAGGISKVVLLP